MKEKVFQVDFNPWHFICNMQCQYCIKHYKYKISNGCLYLKNEKTNEFFFYARIEHLFIRAYCVLKKISENYEVGILTFSGSETFLFNEIFELLDKVKVLFPKIQLISNGLNLNKEFIDKFNKVNTLGNMTITLSLDGITEIANRSRTGNDKKKFQTVYKNFCLLAKENIEFNIYTVLSKLNIEYIEEFFETVAKIKPGCAIQIWTVFGNPKLIIEKEYITFFDNLIKHYNKYNLKLQPIKYYEKLYEYILTGRRTIPCYLPQCSFYLQDTGDIKGCLCNGLTDNGNILRNTVDEIEKSRKNDFLVKSYELNQKENFIPCKLCFINWDIINMFFENQITEAELRMIPIFDDDRLIKMLGKFKSNLVKKV